MGRMRAKPDPGVGPLGVEQFTWDVCEAGYERRRMKYIPRPVGDEPPTATSRVGDVLVPVDVKRFRQASPLKQADLFEHFADIDTAEQAEAFAREHGWLGLPVDTADL